MYQVLKEHAIGMLTAGMYTRAVAGDFVYFSSISRTRCHFREFGTPASQPQTTFFIFTFFNQVS
jgi:hypothetical protein